jgi:cbb3-type cytochrome oxidase subunit 3
VDINQFRAALTVLVVLIFVAIVVWACGAQRRSKFERAARSVLEDELEAGAPATPRGDAK